MAKKKDRAKAPKGKRIKVSKARKKPQRSRASKKKGRKGRKGQGQYSSFFPTNRQIDSNQSHRFRERAGGRRYRPILRSKPPRRYARCRF